MGTEVPVPSDITALVHRWNEGDREALSRLATAAYSDLRAIAGGYMRRESSGHTLQATGLVNELYLRLVDVAAALDSGRLRGRFCTRAIRCHSVCNDAVEGGPVGGA